MLCLSSGCARPVYTHADNWEPIPEQGFALGRIEVESWERLSYLNPIINPMGSPYLLLELESGGRRWMSHAEGAGYFLFPIPSGELKLQKLLLLSPYASQIELIPVEPLSFQIAGARISYLGTLRFALSPSSRSASAALPRTYSRQQTQARLDVVLERRDEQPAAENWLQQRHTALGWPVQPEASLSSRRQEQLLAPWRSD